MAAARRSIELDPSYPLAHRLLGILLSQMRRAEEAASAIRRARELDPLNPATVALSSQVAFAGRDYKSAVKFAREAIAIDPEFWIGYMQLGQALEQSGEPQLALEALNTAGRLSCGNSKPISLRGYIFAKLGQENEARNVLRTLQAVGHDRYVPPYAFALIQAGLDHREEALTWLERAVEAHDVHCVFPPVDPKWDDYREEPRFHAFLRRCAF